MMDLEAIDTGEVQKWLTMVWLMVGAPLIVAALPIPAIEPLRKLIWPVLRRGKLLLRPNESSSVGKGLQKITVPQSFFTHFYVLGLALNTVLLFTALGLATTFSRPDSKHNQTMLGSQFTRDTEKYGSDARRLVFLQLLLEIHLFRRLYECLFVSSFDPSARMSVWGYVIALGYYVAVPLTLFVQSFQDEGFVHAFKAFLKQKLMGRAMSLQDLVPDEWNMTYFLGRVGWTPYVGAAVFLYGSVHQHACHEILAALRQDGQPELGKRYGIPRGDWFELVSSAHYLAEIVIYGGLVIASGGSHPVMWILFVSVAANLYLLAKPTHEWYLSKFDNYPKARHALFPYIG